MSKEPVIELLKISELVFKSIRGDISSEEQEVLSEWINRSEENRVLYKKLTTTENLKRHYGAYSRIKKEEAWERLSDTLPFEEEQPEKIRRMSWLYASAVIAVVLITSLVFLLEKGETAGQKEIVAAADAPLPAEIVHGTSKAMLYTADGNAVSLEDNDTIISETGVQLINEKRTLSYVREGAGEEPDKSKAELNRLVTPKGGEYKLVLSDGTRVWLNADSEFKYPSTFGSEKERIVFLEGEAYFDVAENKAAPFIVKTQNMDVKALGTSFNVMAYKNTVLNQATLVEGKVQVSVKKGEETVEDVLLNPNMQAEFDLNSKSIRSRRVDVSQYIAWKNGLFSFNDQRLEEILVMLSRWYDFEVVFKNEEVKNIRLTGEMKRFESFLTILELIRINSGVRFEVENRTLYCSR